MKKISEQEIFDLIDGKLSEERKAEILRELPNHPEEELLYRSLLMTEGYIKAHAVEKPTVDFTERVTSKVQRMVSQKKRNGILYRALSIIGFIMVFSMIGSVFMVGNAAPGDGSSTQLNLFTSFQDQLNQVFSFMSGAAVQNLFFLIVAFTFLVFLDRILMNRFQLRH